VIKGVLPDQPAPPPQLRPAAVPAQAQAPVAVARPTPATEPAWAATASTGGFFGWLKKLFSGDAPVTPTQTPAAAPIVQPAKPGREERGPRDGGGGREGRGRRGGRDGQRGEGRDGPRAEGRDGPRSEGRGEARGDRGSEDRARRGERSERPEREGRGRRPERAEAAPISGEQANAAPAMDRSERSESGRGESRRNQRPPSPPANEELALPLADAQGLDTDLASAGVAAEGGENGEREASRRRRRRGGRGRGERDEVRAEGSSVTTADEVHEPGLPAAAEFGAETASVHTEGDTEAERPEVEGDEAGSGEPRRRRRGGRGRRDRSEGAVAETGATASETEAPAGAHEAVTSDAATGDAVDSDTVHVAMPLPLEPAMPVAEPAVPPAFKALELPPEPGAAPSTAAAPAPAPVPASAQARGPASLPITAELVAYELPMDELAAVAEGSGLEWVNTDVEKVRMAQEAMANAPKSVPLPRAPKQAVELDDGPLVLVETRKDLSQIKLPFEGR